MKIFVLVFVQNEKLNQDLRSFFRSTFYQLLGQEGNQNPAFVFAVVFVIFSQD